MDGQTRIPKFLNQFFESPLEGRKFAKQMDIINESENDGSIFEEYDEFMKEIVFGIYFAKLNQYFWN